MKFLIFLFLISLNCFASPTRTTEADQLITSDRSKTFSLPSIAGTLAIGILYSQIPSGTINGSNTSFTISYTPISGTNFTLLLDGIALIPTTDYTISGTNISMIVAPATGQTLYAIYTR